MLCVFAYFVVSSITGLKVFRWHYLESRVEAIYDSACSSSFDHLNDVVIFGNICIWIPYSWKIIDTIEPRFADTRLIRNLIFTNCFIFPWEKPIQVL